MIIIRLRGQNLSRVDKTKIEEEEAEKKKQNKKSRLPARGRKKIAPRSDVPRDRRRRRRRLVHTIHNWLYPRRSFLYK